MTDYPDYPEGPKDRRPTAIHEAGHAVVAWCLGVAFDCVDLAESRDDKGATRNGGIHGVAPITSKDQDKVENFVTVCLAGYAACHVFDVVNYGFECDVKLASRTLWKWHDHAPSAFEECKARAIKIIERPENRVAVERLAAHLLQHGTADAEVARSCIARRGA